MEQKLPLLEERPFMDQAVELRAAWANKTKVLKKATSPRSVRQQ